MNLLGGVWFLVAMSSAWGNPPTAPRGATLLSIDLTSGLRTTGDFNTESSRAHRHWRAGALRTQTAARSTKSPSLVRQ